MCESLMKIFLTSKFSRNTEGMDRHHHIPALLVNILGKSAGRGRHWSVRCYS